MSVKEGRTMVRHSAAQSEEAGETLLFLGPLCIRTAAGSTAHLGAGSTAHLRASLLS